MTEEELLRRLRREKTLASLNAIGLEATKLSKDDDVRRAIYDEFLVFDKKVRELLEGDLKEEK